MFVDYSLPGKSGIDVIKEIRILNPEIPVIMITGLGSEKIAVQAMKLGIKDYLTKDEFLTTYTLHPLVTQILLEHRIQQEMILSRRLQADPGQLSVSVYKFGNLGPEPFLSSPLPFKEVVSSQEKDNFLIKLGAHYMTATGAGHEYSRGLFELPVPGFPNFRSFVYSFDVLDPNNQDPRSQGKNYCLLVFLFPTWVQEFLVHPFELEKIIREKIVDITALEQLKSPEVFDRLIHHIFV